MRVLEGKSVFSGIAIGKISILQKADTSVKRTKVENPEAEITRVQEAKEKAVEQLQKLYDKALREVVIFQSVFHDISFAALLSHPVCRLL